MHTIDYPTPQFHRTSPINSLAIVALFFGAISGPASIAIAMLASEIFRWPPAPGLLAILSPQIITTILALLAQDQIAAKNHRGENVALMAFLTVLAWPILGVIILTLQHFGATL